MCQTTRSRRRNSAPAASGEVRPVLTWRNLKHRTLKPASGAHRPVQCRIAYLSAHESGGHRTCPVPHKERLVTPRRALLTRARGLTSGQFLFWPAQPCSSLVTEIRCRRGSCSPPRPWLFSSPQISPRTSLRLPGVQELSPRVEIGFKGGFPVRCPQGVRWYVSNRVD